PVDCPICDQAGECKLQDYYMQYDFKPSRLTGKKVLKNKRKILGPLVVLDQERCILCTRCVRFMAEVAKEPQLGVFGRGSHEVIDTFPDKPLDSNYAGNTIDICPVGALLSRDFRFKARAFFLSASPSVCTGCSRGCSTFLDSYDGQSYRYRPRENPKVNDLWMCDQGRLSYKYLNANRVLETRIGKAGEGRQATREESARHAAEKLKGFAGSEKLAFVVSPLASVEDMLGAFKLAKDGLKLSRVFVSGRPSGKGDHFLLKEDKNPNRKGLEWIAAAFGLRIEPFEALTRALDAGKVQAVYAVGAEVPGDEAQVAAQLGKAEFVVVQAINASPLTDAAHVLLPSTPHAEDHGTFVNFEGHTQRFVGAYAPSGSSRPGWSWAGALLKEFEVPVVWNSARDVFRELAPSVPELKDFKWDSAPRYLKGNRGIMAMPAAADARPPAERERSLL
ncbi:MAG: molybdopterin-dependent oxidoreductase, partial [Myxococcales bacterium]